MKLLPLILLLASTVAGAEEWTTTQITLSHRRTSDQSIEIDVKVRHAITLAQAQAILAKKEAIENVAAKALAKYDVVLAKGESL